MATTRVRAAAVLAGTACAVLTFTTAAPAGAGGPDGKAGGLAGAPAAAVPGGYASWADLARTQLRLNAAADRLVALAALKPGYAGVTVPTDRRQVTLHWKGAVPAEVRTAAAALTAAGTTVGTAAAAYSAAELAQRQAAILAADAADKTVTVRSIGARADGSGLDVGAGGATAGLLSRAAGGVRTVVTAESPALADSVSDTAPWWGGARINVGGYCTTGFPVRRVSDNKPFVLTAGHCVNNGTSVSTAGGGLFMGYATGDSNAYDTALIDVTSAGGYVFAGTTVPTSSTRYLAGSTANYVGNYVCTSGSYSGERCGIRVVATGVTINVGYLIYDTVRAEKTDFTSGGGNGDSGGPVFQVNASAQAVGAGTLTAIDLGTSVPCTGVPAGGGRSCAWRIYYAPLPAALARYGLTVRGY